MRNMAKQIRITIRITNKEYERLLELAKMYEGNLSMTIRKLIEAQNKEQNG